MAEDSLPELLFPGLTATLTSDTERRWVPTVLLAPLLFFALAGGGWVFFILVHQETSFG